MKSTNTQMSTVSSVSFTIVNRLDELAPHRQAWDELLEKVPNTLPTSSYPWLSSYFAHRVGGEESWLCLFGYSGERLVTVWPVVSSKARAMLKQYRRLRMPADLHTMSVQPLFAPDMEQELVPQVLSRLDQSQKDPVTYELTRIPGNSSIVDTLSGSAGSRFCCVGFDDFGSYLNTSGNYGDYFNQLSSGFRRNLRKSNNRLKKNHTSEFQSVRPQTHDESLFRRFLHVEEQNWKGQAGSAISCTSHLVEFYSEMVRNYVGSDRLEWEVLRIDGQDAAMFLAITTGRTKVLFKIGYDEKFARLMPGSLLMERVLQDAFESPEIDEINMISSADWHMRWNPRQRRHVNIRIFPKTAHSFLSLYIPRSARSLAKAQMERRMEKKML